jgi:FRG domain.
MAEAKFSIDNPAKDIHELLDFLKSEEHDIPYVYRGQIKEYNSPLVPSMYRRCLSYSDQAIDNHDPLYERCSLKKIGKKYYGDYVKKFFDYKIEKIYGNCTSNERMEILNSVYEKALKSPALLFAQQRNRLLYNYIGNRLDIIKSILSREEWQLFDLYKGRWMPLINDYDRRIIRIFGFFKPLGFLLGTALAQQYGFSSEGLDATKSIDVACFFATHSSEDDYVRTLDEGIGIIYRLPYQNVYAPRDGGFQYNFYSPHSLVDIDAIFEQMAEDAGDIDNFYKAFETFYTNKMTGKDADYNLIKIPVHAYQNSRIFRQKAVIILPDEIREDLESSEWSIIGNKLPQYQFIEDLSCRDGLEKFYFRHSKDNELELNREYLWPREDPVLSQVIWIISAICQRSFSKDKHFIMHRLDLIDGAYNPGEFLTMCQNIALKNFITISKDNKIFLFE